MALMESSRYIKDVTEAAMSRAILSPYKTLVVRTFFYCDGLAAIKQTHPGQDESYQVDCNRLCSDMQHFSKPDYRASSWYEYNPKALNQ